MMAGSKFINIPPTFGNCQIMKPILFLETPTLSTSAWVDVYELANLLLGMSFTVCEIGTKVYFLFDWNYRLTE